jgi:hypothetical protein
MVIRRLAFGNARALGITKDVQSELNCVIQVHVFVHNIQYAETAQQDALLGMRSHKRPKVEFCATSMLGCRAAVPPQAAAGCSFHKANVHCSPPRG